MTLWADLSKRGFNGVMIQLERMFGANAGRLASQLLYYHTPSKKGDARMWVTSPDGRLWVAMTRADWFAKTGLTESRYKGALKKLVGLELVEQCVRRDRTGRTVTHMRLDIPRLIESIAQHDIEQELRDALNGQDNQSGLDVSTVPLLKPEDLSEEPIATGVAIDTPTGSNYKATGNPETKHTPEPELAMCADVQTVTKLQAKVSGKAPDNFEGWYSPAIEKAYMDAQDVLAKFQPKNRVPPVKGNQAGLVIRWKQHMAELAPDVIHKMTKTDENVLGKFGKAVNESAGSDIAIKTLDFAFANWYDLRTVVKQKRGEYIKSSEPVPGMLLRHYQQLLQLIADQKVKAAPPRSPNAVKPDKLPVVKVQPVPAAPAKALPTPQELEEMWAASLAAVKHKG